MVRSMSLILVLLASMMMGVFSNPVPAPKADSAGIVPLVNGLAYGGIPYGSVTGMLQQYFGSSRGLSNSQVGSNQIYDLGNELLG